MEYVGQIKNGMVVFDEGTPLADGTLVRVEPIAPPQEPLSPLAERLLRLAGTAQGLPPDLAENHDHYLHGRPKK